MHSSLSLPTALLLAALLTLTGCGSGSSALPAERTPPTAEKLTILVEPWMHGDIQQIAADHGSELLGAVPGIGYYRLSAPEGKEWEDMRGAMEGDHRVKASEPDVHMSSPEGDGSTLPAGGLLLAYEIPLQSEILRLGTQVAQVRATGAGVRVAVLDSGVVEHEFLDGHVDPNGWDFIDEDPDPRDEIDGIDGDRDGLIDEGYGHGTFVASLILAVAPDARILPVRVLDSEGQGRLSSIAAAITFAADQEVAVINLSISVQDRMRVLEEAIRAARARGVLVVASAGNTGALDLVIPATLEDAYLVTAVDSNDVRASFASYGEAVDLCAPGVELLGAWPSPTGTARWSGTSFSAALVSGACALLRELHPGDDVQALFGRIETSAAPVDEVNPEAAGRLGRGRLDVGRAAAD